MEAHADSNSENQPPKCPKCGKAMVHRQAKRGASRGDKFWGCPAFPKCRGTIFDQPTPTPGDDGESAEPTESEPQGTQNRLISALNKVAGAIDRIRRWNLELDEPDATGRWNPKHRRKVLRYIYERDSGRCGLCAAEMKIKGAVIEHIVPKVFAVFDVYKGGEAAEGKHYRSMLHKMDNLQAAHTYCNKRKGNTPKIVKWRHPSMPSLGVAQATDGSLFVLPWDPKNNPSGRYKK